MEEDSRISIRDICGASFVGATGIEWICIRAPHDKLYKRKNGEHTFSSNPDTERHYMVPRYPQRTRQEEAWEKEDG